MNGFSSILLNKRKVGHLQRLNKRKPNKKTNKRKNKSFCFKDSDKDKRTKQLQGNDKGQQVIVIQFRGGSHEADVT